MADTSFTAQMAAKLGLDEKYVIPYGYDKAKVSLEVLKQEYCRTTREALLREGLLPENTHMCPKVSQKCNLSASKASGIRSPR